MTLYMRPSIALLSLAAVAGTTLAFAAEPGNTGELQFIESVGLHEFSGRMVARPLQSNTLFEMGLSDTEAKVERQAASDLMAQFDLVEYVWQTDEYVFHLPAGMTENELATAIMGTGQFQYAEPDWIVYPLDTCTSDSRLNSQWHHNSNRMQSCDAWTIHTGNPTTSIGICDTGIKTTHEDFAQNRLEGYNAVNRRWENDGGSITDINGHGTMTSGCAAANGDNGRGVSGAGWNLSHRMMRVSNSSGGGAYMSDLTHAARTSVEAGDKVASVSYSGVDDSSVRSAATYIKGIGGLLIWAAGNEGRRLGAGNRDNDDLIVVGATTSSDTKPSWSNYGPFVDLVAPGDNIYTTTRNTNSSYGRASGTSFACPLVAGLAGLIWSADPSLTPDQVEQVLKDTCKDLGSSGIDDTYGYGRINSFDALSAVGAFQLSVDVLPLLAGNNHTFYATGGDPNTNTGLAYSLRGEGSTWIPDLGVYVDLNRAKLAGTINRSNSQGDTFWTLRIPNPGRSRLIWIQSAQSSGRLTNIILTQINP